MKPQRGAALLVILLILGSLGAYFALSAWPASNHEIERDRITANALAAAKSALIGWSLAQGDVGAGAIARPGNLPCPDTANSGKQAGPCVAGAIGRLPWKTLGIEELRDADGETLWYAVSGNFRHANLQAAALNSDTLGTLKLYASNGSNLLTPAGEEFAAVILAPGRLVAGQDRAPAVTTIAINYLEAANGRNNAVAGGPFIAGPVKDASGNLILNDRLIGISARELMAVVEKRVLHQAQAALTQYHAAHGGKYPNPALPSCLLKISNIASPNICSGSTSVCFGRLPEDSLAPYVASWFQQNGWGRVLTYAVNKNAVVDGSAAECTDALSLNSQPRSYVLFSPGTAISPQLRPSASLAHYLEDSANQDAWTSGNSNQAAFVSPAGLGNDQMRSSP